ncbi:rod shape-determining protein MreC [Nocardioides sp. SYSU D00038]|uniref:rod shape-determining protein MreC n=1 Tax=Nocardioides sp. SYSU D00038 TaxID=2812554 RepID=UPI0019689645|nr:rod shape-determining protein MreC [Nocardioides sp. SYSU D00038]
MALDTSPPSSQPVRQSAVRQRERVNRRGSLEPGRPGRPKRPLVVALVLAAVTLMTVDRGADGSPVDPARRAVGEVLGPVQAGVAHALDPVLSLPRWVGDQGDLVDRVDDLEAENAELRQQLARTDVDRNRLAEYDGLTAAAEDLGYAMVPARVVGYGAAQTFTRTVTIDAGSRAGLAPDMTVVAAEGLVGRVLRVTSTTATVLLVVDDRSVVGARLGSSMEIGSLTGDGTLDDDGALDLEQVDETAVPRRGDVVVTWGSDAGAPYLSGIPVGEVTAVYSNVRDMTQRAAVRAYVDFSALDVVGVVVPSGTASDRAVIEPDGALR